MEFGICVIVEMIYVSKVRVVLYVMGGGVCVFGWLMSVLRCLNILLDVCVLYVCESVFEMFGRVMDDDVELYCLWEVVEVLVSVVYVRVV